MIDASDYRINTPQVVLEVFDDEVILVNLDVGAYYSTEGAGGRVVALLNLGTPIPELVSILQAEFIGVKESIAASVGAFLAQMEAEGLIVKTAVLGAAGHGVPREGSPRPFREPTLQKYTDLRDLLLLDPIHDVDEAGWPVRKPLDV